MASRITDTDQGYKAMIKRVIGMTPVTIATGILEKDADKAHGDNAMSIIEVAVWNEFGTSDGHVPERSFIRAWFDENEPTLREILSTLMTRAIKGEMTRQQVLDQMGAYCVGSIQQRIASGIAPANAPSTIARKGSSTPLIDKGHLRSAVSFDIREGVRSGGGSE